MNKSLDNIQIDDLMKKLPPVLNDIVNDFVGDGDIITEKGIVSFSQTSFMTELKKVHNDKKVKSFDINIFRELTITSDYKGLFEKVKSINGNVKLIGDMSLMFAGCDLLVKLGDKCDTCKVTDMSYMFFESTRFNQPLKWKTKNVTNMSHMFYGATSFDKPLKWNTKNVTDMSYMFASATSFDKSLKFKTKNVTNMSYMFYYAKSFNQPLKWKTKNVTNMSGMFRQATSFNQPLKFKTKNVTNMSYMFASATSFDQPLKFKTKNVTNKYNMFYGTKTSFEDVIKQKSN